MMKIHQVILRDLLKIRGPKGELFLYTVCNDIRRRKANGERYAFLISLVLHSCLKNLNRPIRTAFTKRINHSTFYRYSTTTFLIVFNRFEIKTVRVFYVRLSSSRIKTTLQFKRGIRDWIQIYKWILICVISCLKITENCWWSGSLL